MKKAKKTNQYSDWRNRVISSTSWLSVMAQGMIQCPNCQRKANIAHYHYVAQSKRFKVTYFCWHCMTNGTVYVEKLPQGAARDYNMGEIIYGNDR